MVFGIVGFLRALPNSTSSNYFFLILGGLLSVCGWCHQYLHFLQLITKLINGNISLKIWPISLKYIKPNSESRLTPIQYWGTGGQMFCSIACGYILERFLFDIFPSISSRLLCLLNVENKNTTKYFYFNFYLLNFHGKLIWIFFFVGNFWHFLCVVW